MGRSAHLVITTETGEIFNIEIDAAEQVENLKALIEVEVCVNKISANKKYIQNQILRNNIRRELC